MRHDRSSSENTDHRPRGPDETAEHHEDKADGCDPEDAKAKDEADGSARPEGAKAADAAPAAEGPSRADARGRTAQPQRDRTRTRGGFKANRHKEDRIPCRWCNRPVAATAAGREQHESSMYCLSRKYYWHVGNMTWERAEKEASKQLEREWQRANGQMAPPEPRDPPRNKVEPEPSRSARGTYTRYSPRKERAEREREEAQREPSRSRRERKERARKETECEPSRSERGARPRKSAEEPRPRSRRLEEGEPVELKSAHRSPQQTRRDRGRHEESRRREHSRGRGKSSRRATRKSRSRRRDQDKKAADQKETKHSTEERPRETAGKKEVKKMKSHAPDAAKPPEEESSSSDSSSSSSEEKAPASSSASKSPIASKAAAKVAVKSAAKKSAAKKSPDTPQPPAELPAGGQASSSSSRGVDTDRAELATKLLRTAMEVVLKKD